LFFKTTEDVVYLALADMPDLTQVCNQLLMKIISVCRLSRKQPKQSICGDNEPMYFFRGGHDWIDPLSEYTVLHCKRTGSIIRLSVGYAFLLNPTVLISQIRPLAVLIYFNDSKLVGIAGRKPVGTAPM